MPDIAQAAIALTVNGTPEGVAAVQSGDTLHGTIDGLDDLHLRIV